MATQGPKQILFGEFAAVAKCLSHPHRLELLEQLAQGERSVEILAQKVGLSTANASQHLRNMLRAGIVTSAREGKFVIYRLADHAVLDLLSSLRTITERNSAVVEQLVRNYFSNLAFSGAGYAQRAAAAIARRRSHGSGCASHRRVRVGASAGSGEYPAAGAQRPTFKIQAFAGDHRLLPRALLCVVLRSRRSSAPAWLQGSPVGGRLTRMACGRTASSHRYLRSSTAVRLAIKRQASV